MACRSLTRVLRNVRLTQTTPCSSILRLNGPAITRYPSRNGTASKLLYPLWLVYIVWSWQKCTILSSSGTRFFFCNSWDNRNKPHLQTFDRGFPCFPPLLRRSVCKVCLLFPQIEIEEESPAITDEVSSALAYFEKKGFKIIGILSCQRVLFSIGMYHQWLCSCSFPCHILPSLPI